MENCPTEHDAPVKIFLDDSEPGINGVNMSGYISVEAFDRETVGDVTIVIEVTRCTLDLKICKKGANFNFKDFCQKLSDVNKNYGKVFTALKPKM